MNLHFSFKAESAKTPDVEREIQQYVHKLDRYLTAFRPDLVHLHGTIDQKIREGFTISLNLRLPTGQLAAQESGQVLLGALKICFTELISQLKRHKELIRNEHRWRRGRKAPRGAVAELQDNVEQYVARRVNHSGTQPQRVRPETRKADISAESFESPSLFHSDVRAFLNGNLGKLKSFVERELRYREDNGSLQPGSISVEEVLDETVVNALSGEQESNSMATEKWIYRVALDSIEHLLAGNGDESALALEETIGTQNVTGDDEEFLQYHQPGERHNREDFLPNQQAATPEDAAANDEMITQVEDALRGVSAEQRRAFVLLTIEGFSVEEIAAVMERESPEVKKLINSARDHVVKKLPPTNALKKKLIEHSEVA